MKKFALILAVFVLAGFSALAQTGPFAKQYSAEQVLTKSGKGVMTSKIYVDQGKIRVEVNVQGMTIATIMRPDTKTIYSIMPQQKMVMQIPFKSEDELMVLSMSDDAARELVGTETVNGQDCEKYKMSKGSDSIFLWMNKSTHVPVKMVSADNAVTAEWKNVVVGPQPASLFEPPAGYQLVKIPAGGLPAKK